MGIKSMLLLNQRPLVIVPELAVILGLNESIILQQVHYWLENNRKNDRHFYDNHTWTYNTLMDWQKQFPFFSYRTLQRTILELEKKKVLLSGNYNEMKIDRTKWYSIDYEVLETLINSHSANLA